MTEIEMKRCGVDVRVGPVRDAPSLDRIPAADLELSACSGCGAKQPVWIDDEFLRYAPVEICVTLRRLVESNHGGIGGLADPDAVIENLLIRPRLYFITGVWRTCAMRLPPASAIAMFIGWPSSLAFCSAAAIIFRASFNVIIDGLLQRLARRLVLASLRAPFRTPNVCRSSE